MMELSQTVENITIDKYKCHPHGILDNYNLILSYSRLQPNNYLQ